MEGRSVLDAAFDSARRAVDDDANGRIASAIANYDICVNLLRSCLSDPQYAQHGPMIAQKIDEYASRRNVLSMPVAVSLPSVPAPQPQHLSSTVLPAKDTGVSINDILRLAFDVAQHARQEDAVGNLKGALDLYTQALESFLVVYREETNATLKEQLKQTILEYTTRAEAIKAQLQPPPPQQQQFLQPFPPQYPPNSNYPTYGTSSPYPPGAAGGAGGAASTGAPRRSLSIRNEDKDGPYKETVRKAHPGYAGAVELVVSIPRRKYVLDEVIPVHVEVDNQCGRQVESVKCYLICNTDSYYWKSPDAQERKHDSVKTLPRIFTFGTVFPLAHGLRFEGSFEYELGPRLKPTARADPNTLIREYVLVVKCFFQKPWRDLKCFIPIAIFEKKE